MRARVILLLLTFLGVATATGGAGARVQAQATCAVTGERQMLVLEPRPVQWGGEVDVNVLLDVDCGASSRPVLTLREAIPESLVFQPGVGTPPDRAGADGLTWRIPEPTGRITVTYRVYVTPDPADLEPTGRTEITWPMDLELDVDGRVERPAPPPVDPLIVARRPGARGCDLDARVDVEPPSVAIGEPFTATLSLTFGRCRYPGPRQRAVLAVQTVSDAARLADQVSALKALAGHAAGYQSGQPGMVGLAAPGAAGTVALAPTEDSGRLGAWLDGLGSGEPAPLDAAVDAALALLPDWPDHHEVVYAVTHEAAPPVDPSAWRRSQSAATARGVDLVVLCIGACDPILSPELSVPAWASVRYRAEALVAAHLGPPADVSPVTVHAEMQEYLDLLPESPVPPADASTTSITWRDLAARPGEALRLSYRAAIDRWGRFPVGASGRADLPAADGRELVSVLLLPGLVTVRRPTGDAPPCTAVADKSAAPQRLPLGEETAVTLFLRPECQELEQSTRIVLSLDRSGSMGFGVEFSYVKLAAKALADLLAVETTAERRFGMVSHGDPPEVVVPLTNDPDEIQRGIDALLARGQDNLGASIRQATDLLLAARTGPPGDTDEILVVLSDGGQTYPPSSAIPAAVEAKAEGIRVVTVCARTASSDCEVVARLASDPDDAFEVDRVDRALERFVEIGLQLRQVRIARAEVVDDLAPNLRLVPASLHPAPDRATGGRLVWTIERPSPLGVRLSYRAQPLLLGRQPLHVWSEARFTDERGRDGHAVFPDPEVETYGEPALGPCSALLATVADDADATVGRPITTSLQARIECPPRSVPLDTVLAIDHSSSMGTFSRLENAKAAADAFLDALDPEQAWVGMIGFSGAVTARVPLTDDYVAVRRAVDRLVPDGQTNLGAAIRGAHELFSDRRPDTNAAIVLLTDGRTSGAIDSVLAAADEAKADDILIVTFCAGSCDPELSRVASRPDLAITVADSAHLVALYRQLAVELAHDTARDVTIEQWLPDGLEVLPGTARPTPDEGPAGGRSAWRVDRIPTGGLTVTLGLLPLRSGAMPLGQTWLTYRYGSSGYGYARFPDRVVNVGADPPATPTPWVTRAPTPTRPPLPSATRTPTRPGPLPGPHRAYVPSAAKRGP